MLAWHKYLAEWLEADGLGGFSSGTVCGVRTRRYHGLLLVDVQAAGRILLVAGLDAWATTADGRYALTHDERMASTDRPEGPLALSDFTTVPWPTWWFTLDHQTIIRQELVVPRGVPGVALRWTSEGNTPVELHVRPLIAARDYHSLQRAADQLDMTTHRHEGTCLEWHPVAHYPSIFSESNARFIAEPQQHRSFTYWQERERGLDDGEDLASPGEFVWTLQGNDAILLLSSAERFTRHAGNDGWSAEPTWIRLQRSERQRRLAVSDLDRAADAYLVYRQQRPTIIAGYPWFTDWGRDTFISLRGLCLRTARWDWAEQILLAWAATVSEGMVPNRFPDHDDKPEYNSVDASLWYIVAIHEFLNTMQQTGQPVDASVETGLIQAAQQIVTHYAQGTRFGIGLDRSDGLLAAGQTGLQLTWMDAKIGDWVVTPRIGKPIEVQCLWLHALHWLSQFDRAWQPLFEQGKASLVERFWCEREGYLYDVIDVDHVAGAVDRSFRPNQIFAVGGLPIAFLDGPRAQQVVEQVEHRLLTPLGLRTLDPQDPAYQPQCTGDLRQRDGAYHQGTVWPWLMGAFVEAWVRVHGSHPEVRQEARRRFVAPLLHQRFTTGLGHLPEIADGDPPHTPRGCPFQAWSLAELLRIERTILAD